MHRSNREAEYMRKLSTYFKCAADMDERLPLKGPVMVHIVFRMRRPKSVRSDRAFIPHTVRPDLENLVKPVIDAANGILWEDDRQIWRMTAVKGREEPGTYPSVLLIVEAGE